MFSLPIVLAALGPVSSSSETTGDPQHLVLMIVYASVALLFSFLCSVAEAVLLSVSPSYISHLEKEGRKSAALLKKLKTNVDRSLAAILTLNTIAHTVGAGGAGAEAAAYLGDKYVGIAMAVLTLLILFLSEIIPKTIGAMYWRGLATPTAHFIRGLLIALYPLVVISERLTRLLTRGRDVHSVSREEIVALADLGEETGQLDEKESRVLQNLFRFPQLCAKDIMTPRTVVFALQKDVTVHEALEAHPEIPFSRIPLYGDNRDDFVGFVLKTDIFLFEYRGQGDAPLSDLRRDLPAVPATSSLSKVLEELLDRRVHLMALVDEYGGLAGVVSLEDLVETLMGIEIVDEADTIDDLRRLARDRWERRMEQLGYEWDSDNASPE